MDSTMLVTLLSGIGSSLGYQSIKGKDWHWMVNLALSFLAGAGVAYMQGQSTQQALYAGFVALGSYGAFGQSAIYQKIKMELLPRLLGVAQQATTSVATGVTQGLGAAQKLDANSWSIEANAIYNQYKADGDSAKAKASVDALNEKYKGIVPPTPPGWPV